MKIPFAIVLLLVLSGCNKQESLNTFIGKKTKQNGVTSKEFYPLQLNNIWSYTLITFDTLNKRFDTTHYQENITKILIDQKTKDTFYTTNGVHYYHNLNDSTVITLDQNYKSQVRYTANKTQVVKTLGSIVFQENGKKYIATYSCWPGKEMIGNYACYIHHTETNEVSGTPYQRVTKYFCPGIGVVKTEVLQFLYKDGGGEHYYLRALYSLSNYYFY